jgi:hypothetical protein
MAKSKILSDSIKGGLITAGIFVFMVLVAYSCSATNANTSGDLIAPGPKWKLNLTVDTDKGVPVGRLKMVDPATGATRLWDDKASCDAFTKSSEFWQSLGPLAEALVAKGNDPLHTLMAWECVPDGPKGENI